MHALESLHYRVTEQLTHRFVHSFCGNVACGGGINILRDEALMRFDGSAVRPAFFQLVDAGRKGKAQGPDFFQISRSNEGTPLLRIKDS